MILLEEHPLSNPQSAGIGVSSVINVGLRQLDSDIEALPSRLNSSVSPRWGSLYSVFKDDVYLNEALQREGPLCGSCLFRHGADYPSKCERLHSLAVTEFSMTLVGQVAQ